MGDGSATIKALPFKNGWVTLLTRESYLPGVVLLAHSLVKHKSKYPFLVLITPSFPELMVSTLRRECALTNSHVLEIESLTPAKENTPASLIASRFEDTWTKLRVFELHKYGLEKMVFLDADMLVYKNMDELFDLELPRDWIAANHVCVCNLDDDKWAPQTWTKENCAFINSGPLSPPPPVPNLKEDPNAKQTHTLLNSGLFIFTPFESQWQDILQFLNTDTRVKQYLFPDQDFLADFFYGRWKSVRWVYNALKTWKYWHPNFWRDEEVRNLHYIVDKPWNKRVGKDGVAGYLGNDGITHQWWWDEYRRWEQQRKAHGENDILEMVRSVTAAPLEE